MHAKGERQVRAGKCRSDALMMQEMIMIARDLTFKIVKGAAVPFRSTKEALIWARANGLIGRMAESETGGKGVVSISAESIREALNPRQREKSDSDRVHFAALGKLRDLIRESRILEMHPDWQKERMADGTRMQRTDGMRLKQGSAF